MKVLAWVVITMQVAYVAVVPFSIGKPRKSYSAGAYVVGLFFAAVELSVAGRVLGWW